MIGRFVGRILGEHFTRRGAPKKPFHSYQDAYLFIREKNLSQHPYQCTFCNKWHLATSGR